MSSAPLAATDPPKRAPLGEIALAIGAIALTSFGGGQKASIRQAFVTKRGWISDAEFLEGLELAQVMPGPNLINLVIFIGGRLRGWLGAVVALLAVSIPPFVIVLAVGAIYFRIAGISYVHAALVGCAAGAIGLTLANAIDLTREQALRPLPLLFLIVTAVAVSWFKVSLLLVLVVLGPVCVALYRPAKAP